MKDLNVTASICPFSSYLKILLNYWADFYTYSLWKENMLISLLNYIALQCTFLLLFSSPAIILDLSTLCS